MAEIKSIVNRQQELKIPTIFIDEQYKLERNNNVGEACEKSCFFQVINHGIPLATTDEMINGVVRFYEQDDEAKKEIYSRDYSKKVYYDSKIDLYKAEATTNLICRDIMIEYSSKMMKLGQTLLELMSEALGLNRSYLEDIGCGEGMLVKCRYYPPCPEPDLTLGSSSHTDTGFCTVVLQDEIGGLQILYQTGLMLILSVGLVNLDDMIIVHRVLAKKKGPRISVASFFRTQLPPENASRLYGPINELTSQDIKLLLESNSKQISPIP
ncbi:hypothetical protein GOBAR_AA16834 [Gossypium barbadense]|uniref:Fe2OG dioxygenase domain-containing protein n=1 Tax=Gossypium barbadense TaxID=3634 RepID=A0A2P5XKF9_GOSBA|nr:hypothetical protein GOBAR_AA16834 [Gossypium barbadense]